MTTTATIASIPPKPIGSTWTDDQWRAIVTSGSNILVAAAAGSGKTAVLVERIIRKISADTDVDRLLVATFTKAAAAEMKERIRIALEKELDKNLGSDHLRRQLALMGRASITTLHSFCLDVIRRYYSLIGLDPGFRIANETEAELLRMDVLDALFEERYEVIDSKEGQAFYELVERFGGERGDEPLYALVMKLYNFSQSHPWPKSWLQDTAAEFRVKDAEELGRTEWVQSIAAAVNMSLQGAQSLLEQAMDITRLPAGPDAYAETFQDDLNVIHALQRKVNHEPWETWHEAFTTASFGKLKSQRGDACDKVLQEQAKELRDSVKKLIADMTDELFTRTPEQFAAELLEMAPLMETLSGLADEFGSRFEAAKLEKGLIDFGDMEHYCLRILRDSSSTPAQMVPSAAALEYQQQFQEVLLDEYQDTNMVQEAIVSLIARPGKGNRFMVGDVKQSIYRFRLAEPGLFLRKYKTYLTSDDMQGADADAVDSDSGMDEEQEYGVRIDLARNFRSRQEVVDGVNNVFRAIMREKAAEMDYDQRAELVCGASYPSASDGGAPERYAVEFAVLDKGGKSSGETDVDAEENSESEVSFDSEPAEDLQTVELEARWIASQILRLKGMQAGEDAASEEPFQVYDGKKGRKRPLAWRDIVILLRADKQWAPTIIEELQQHGIPAYAELSSGYFEATEVETMLSLLRVIDNPYQDIPLAGTLRSPLVGLTGEELALIRIAGGRVAFYEAVRLAADDGAIPESTQRKLVQFLAALETWREEARLGALADLLWRIYRETGYYDLVGGMTGGLQRQANLRALHDRTRQYEATTLRGLFRFLRFIDRMRESGGDLGTARALGEQEDVVRIMSIHKSKGLEFPVVFAAGLGKQFNKRDLTSQFLMHKQLGFGPRYVDTDLRVSYPTLPYLAIRQRLGMETLAEEMRILYVALTRPKEKMFLVGTVADAEKQLQRWASALNREGQLPDFRIAGASKFIDWLGPLAMEAGIPIVVEQADEELALETQESVEREAAETARQPEIEDELSRLRAFKDWKTAVVPASVLGFEAAAGAVEDTEAMEAFAERMQAVQSLVPLPISSEAASEIDRRLSWRYPYAAATTTAAKSSVTEMKRLHAEFGGDDEVLLLPEIAEAAEAANVEVVEVVMEELEELVEPEEPEEPGEVVQLDLFAMAEDEGQVELFFDHEAASHVHEEMSQTEATRKFEASATKSGGGEYTFRLRRPKFMEEASMTAAERGTVSHLVMQHIPITGEVTEETVRETVNRLREQSMLSKQQADAVDIAGSAAFFQSGVGKRLLEAQWVRRETPFSCTFPATRVYPGWDEGLEEEPILIQGVIDCLFEDEQGLVLLDYKTDRIQMKQWEQAAERHRFQLTLYAEAIESVIGRKINECYVFFFDGGRAVKLF
ncbi:helicase-exonuclease AddAB subunit AddA [Paenibacillus sp. OV219]|uniref:helicase-exonuclease AddAB subunit AddA n=1 Tax=Paenibacillus sp. OV219 TaxID=1884377 RepID=UPI0008CC3097|nr:helicase-exonuclease AddAB subunit AddA [Paenibacillus sp. OV219]SEN08804.1 DNA helicase/exodeoxyribonuclease V, subunit A [Paenibacillus sp. OV219]